MSIKQTCESESHSVTHKEKPVMNLLLPKQTHSGMNKHAVLKERHY